MKMFNSCTTEEDGPTMNITTVGIDLAKNVFHLHGVDGNGKVMLRKRMSRRRVLEWAVNLPPCRIGMEACSGSNYWAQVLGAHGHDVRLMSPQFVKPYVKSNKNDRNNAEAICEAVTRPNMRFVRPKSVEQQDIQSLHRIRSRLVGRRTALVNQIRGLLHEYGIILPQGIGHVRRRLPELLEDGENALTILSRGFFGGLYDELRCIDERIAGMERARFNVCSSTANCASVSRASKASVRSPPRHWWQRSVTRAPFVVAGRWRPGWVWCHANAPRAAARACSGSANEATGT
jgi:hypothetical protein